jgi:hypothetical protein
MRKTVRRASLVLALTPMLTLPTTLAITSMAGAATAPLGSSQTVTTPAPGSTASANAVDVDGIVTVGGTSSSSNSDGGSAHADALDVLGTRVSGGDSSDPNKPASGNIIGTGDTPVGDAEVAPYSASVKHDATSSSADADAALAHAGLAGLLEVWVLHSHSHSDWSSDQSNGSASSDGAEVSGAGHDIKVLHAETASGHKGSSALLVLDGQGIGTSDQAGGACALDLSPIAQVLCLTATGGVGKNGQTTSGAAVLSATGMVPGTTLVGAGSSGSAGVAATKPASHSTEAGPLPHTSGPAAASSSLPFTGLEAGLLATYGAALAGLGAAIVAAARRRRVGPVRG